MLFLKEQLPRLTSDTSRRLAILTLALIVLVAATSFYATASSGLQSHVAVHISRFVSQLSDSNATVFGVARAQVKEQETGPGPEFTAGRLGVLNLAPQYAADYVTTRQYFAAEPLARPDDGKTISGALLFLNGPARPISDGKITIRLRPIPGSPLAKAISSQPRVAVVMSDHRPMPDWRAIDALAIDLADTPSDQDRGKYHHYAFLLNSFYAVRHGYDFVFVAVPDSTELPNQRHTAWAKVLAVKAIINEYDYIAYVDSDTFFRRQLLTVEEIAGKYGIGPGENASSGVIADDANDVLRPGIGGNHFLISQDMPGAAHTANTGAWIVYAPNGASKQMMHQFFAAWWARPVIDQGSRDTIKNWPWEQGAFHLIFKSWMTRMGIVVAPRRYITTPDGEVIRHFWGAWTEIKERTLKLQSAIVLEFADYMSVFLKSVLAPPPPPPPPRAPSPT